MGFIDSIFNNGTRLRQATTKDIKAVAEFNGRMHEEPDEKGKIAAWTEDLMSGKHPTTKASDFLIVETEQNEVVSSTCLIPQTWSYEDIEFPVGRPELVGTDENWHKKGLVREQFDVLHKMSDEKGDLMQVITGIPWYYRQFGYSHALDLGGGRQFDHTRPDNKPSVKIEDEKLSWKAATVEDIPLLQKYYDIHGRNYLINSGRNDEIWTFDLAGKSPDSIHDKRYWIISYPDGRPAGTIGFAHWHHATIINEIACETTQSMREFALYVTRAIGRYIEDHNKVAETDDTQKPIHTRLIFYLGQDHAVYRALGRQLGDQAKSYAWYIRIPDIPAFLRHIRPVLERRLANSVMVGHSGVHRVSLYKEHFSINFKDGKITNIGSYNKKQPQEGDTIFTRPEFIQLICGHKSFEEINHIHIDCGGNNEAWVLMDILFPKMHSNPMGVN
ncbi:MAG: putative N-acetyltransferase YhbS [Cellvibrionaceae bacterium]|jgi:predicted N-acetyltransferase YhbS